MKEILKNNFLFLVPENLSQKGQSFFRDRYDLWETASFFVYDYYSDRCKTFIDIGAWNGCTAIYAAKLNRHVISIEPDPVAVDDFKKIVMHNSPEKITLIDKPLFSQKKEVNFAPRNDTWNSSSSRIKTNVQGEFISMNSVTFEDISAAIDPKTSLNPNNTSMIKIDIEGGEEFLIQDMTRFDIDVPLFVSFHLEWWDQSPEYIFELQNFFDRYEYIYVVTSFGESESDFERISRDKICDFLYVNRFASVLLTSKEFTAIDRMNSFLKAKKEQRIEKKLNILSRQMLKIKCG